MVLPIERRELGHVTFRNLSKDEIHLRLLAETKPDSFILQKLVVANKVLSAACCLQDEIMARFGFQRASNA